MVVNMFKFKEVTQPRLFLFGSGGTGGFALEFLTRLLAGKNATIEVFDGDHVELKNLKRQNFTQDDITQNKAEVLVNKLSNSVLDAPNLIGHPDYIYDVNDLLMHILLNLEDDETPILISAVDNVETRRLINQTAEALKEAGADTILIDSGNSDQGGQVVVFANYDVQQYTSLGQPTDQKITLPSMLTLFPEIDVIKNDSDRNPAFVTTCAENAESVPQAMMMNVRNADIITNIISNIVDNHIFMSNIWLSEIVTSTTKTDFRLG